MEGVGDLIPVKNPRRVEKNSLHFLGILTHIKKNPPVTIPALVEFPVKQTEGANRDTEEINKKGCGSNHRPKVNSSISYPNTEKEHQLLSVSLSCSRNGPPCYSSGDHTSDSNYSTASKDSFQMHNSRYKSPEKYKTNSSNCDSRCCNEQLCIKTPHSEKHNDSIYSSEPKKPNCDLKSKLHNNKNAPKNQNSQSFSFCNRSDEEEIMPEGIYDKFALFRGPRQYSGHKLDPNERRSRESSDSLDPEDGYSYHTNTKYDKGATHDKFEAFTARRQISGDQFYSAAKNHKKLSNQKNHEQNHVNNKFDKDIAYDKFAAFRAQQHSGEIFELNENNLKVFNDSFDQNYRNFSENKYDRGTSHDKNAALRVLDKFGLNRRNHKTYNDRFDKNDKSDNKYNRDTTHNKLPAFKTPQLYLGDQINTKEMSNEEEIIAEETSHDKFALFRGPLESSEDKFCFDKRSKISRSFGQEDQRNYSDNKFDRNAMHEKSVTPGHYKDQSNSIERCKNVQDSFDQKDVGYGDNKFKGSATCDKFAAFRTRHQYSRDQFDSNDKNIKISKETFDQEQDFRNHVDYKFDRDAAHRHSSGRFNTRQNFSIELNPAERKFSSNCYKPRGNFACKNKKNIDSFDVNKEIHYSKNQCEFSQNSPTCQISDISDKKLKVNFQTTSVSKLPELTQCLEWDVNESSSPNLNETNIQNLDWNIEEFVQTSSSKIKTTETVCTFNKSPELTQCLEWNIDESSTTNSNKTNIQNLDWNIEESVQSNRNQTSSSTVKTEICHTFNKSPELSQCLEWNVDKSSPTILNETNIQSLDWKIDDSDALNSNQNFRCKIKPHEMSHTVPKSTDIQSLQRNINDSVESKTNKKSGSKLKISGATNVVSKPLHIQNHDEIVPSNSRKYSNTSSQIKETSLSNTVSELQDIQSLEWNLDA